MTDKSCKRYCVAGRVQGVYFRASAAQEGRRLRLQGWALNLADGRVEVVACGSQKNVAALARWLRDGPPLARVKQVDESFEDPGLFDQMQKPAGAVFF